MNDTIHEQMLELIEEQGTFYEQYHGLTPVAARIFSFLIIKGTIGVSFEEIVETISASKSTVSTNLKLLINSERAKYYTKPGDRKRYFHVSPLHYISSLDHQMKRLEVEMGINSKIIAFKQKANDTIEDKDEQFYIPPMPSPYRTYLERCSALCQELKEFLKEHYNI